MARRRFPDTPIRLAVTGLDAQAMGMAEFSQDTGHAEPLLRQVRVAPALPGEVVDASVYGRRQGAWQARVVAVPEAAENRVQPACAVFDRCGGCALQHLDRGGQLAWKQSQVAALFAAAGVAPQTWRAPVALEPYGYRRKARLGVRRVSGLGGALVGFRERGSSRVVDMRACPVLDPRVADLVGPLRDLISALSVPAAVPQVEVAAGDDGVALVLRHVEPLDAADHGQLAAFAAAHGVHIWLQAGGPETATPLDPAAPREFSSRLPCPAGGADLEYRFGPMEFVQVNAALNRRLVADAVALLDPGAADRVLDLFCGNGNFSLPLARRAASVVGLEGSPELVQRATANAERNAVDNVRFAVADLYRDSTPVPDLQSADLVLLDPPRSGAEQVVAALDPARHRKVLYVACGPAALARDAARLCAAGYRMASAGVYDMFPQTAHVETMALFVAPGADAGGGHG